MRLCWLEDVIGRRSLTGALAAKSFGEKMPQHKRTGLITYKSEKHSARVKPQIPMTEAKEAWNESVNAENRYSFLYRFSLDLKKKNDGPVIRFVCVIHPDVRDC